MAISKLNLASISFSKNHCNKVLLKLLESNNFHPEPASKFANSVAGVSIYQQENQHSELLDKLVDISKSYDIDLKEINIDETMLNVISMKNYLDKFLLEIEQIAAVKRQLDIIVLENQEAIIQLQHVADINVNFDELFTCKYLQVRFGKLLLSNLKKLTYYDGLPFIYKSFRDEDNYTWCMYITTPSDAPEIDNIFSSLYFQRVHIPEFVHGEPELAISQIEEETNGAILQINELKQQIVDIFKKEEDKINQIYTFLKYMDEVSVLQKYTVVIGDRLSVFGFVPVKEAKKFKKNLETIDQVEVDLKPPNSDARLEAPTLIKNGWFTKPFRIFVEMYGVPKYNEFDPTLFVAISYTLLFGIMFGDVGQGLLLSLIGYLAYKKKNMQLGAVGIRLGISSAFFGLIFGSVFGNEEILKPFFNVMDAQNTMVLLMCAIGLGVILILIAMIFNTILNFKKRNIGEAIFSQNGISGLIFYTSILLIAITSVFNLNFDIYLMILIFSSLICIFLKEPLSRKLEHKEMFPHGIGAFFTEAFFELFEICLSFITNTMSFLRVGGFVLSHAGMMLVVYTMAHMVGGIPYWIILVFGNIFVMCLEGLIVGIQVLRLEFYEMFSRYYEGNGIPFKTIKENNQGGI